MGGAAVFLTRAHQVFHHRGAEPAPIFLLPLMGLPAG